MANLPPIIAAIIQREIGGRSGIENVPGDHGGLTGWGITHTTLPDWLGFAGLRRDLWTVNDLNPERATKLYKAAGTHYLIHLVQDQKTAEHLFDCIVNPGPSCILWIQRALDLKLDGVIGTKQTLPAINRDPLAIDRLLWRGRVRHYVRRVREDATQAKFVVGWVERAMRFCRD